MGLLPGWSRPPRGEELPGPAPLPGAAQRRRAIAALAIAAGVLLLRPWPPLLWLPGWLVGLLLLWALAEAIRWQWWPRRWQ